MNWVKAAWIFMLSMLGGASVLSWGESAWGADRLVDIRYCGVENIKRDETGKIVRHADVIREFRKLYPCPVTGATTGACPGWSINHPVPLVCGGCDAVSNLDWMPNSIKSCTSADCRDRWEQSVYCPPPRGRARPRPPPQTEPARHPAWMVQSSHRCHSTVSRCPLQTRLAGNG